MNINLINQTHLGYQIKIQIKKKINYYYYIRTLKEKYTFIIKNNVYNFLFILLFSLMVNL